MKRLQENSIPIEQLPLPWASALPGILGSLQFQLDGILHKSVPHEWLGLVSSHTTKHSYANHDWQEALQSALQLAQRQGWGVLCTQDAPYSEIITHACKRFFVPFRKIILSEPTNAKHGPQVSGFEPRHSCDFGNLWLYPSQGKGEMPTHDSALVFIANHLFVLKLREGGKVAALLSQRLRCPDIPLGSTYLSLPTAYTAKARPPKATNWLTLGAIGWLKTKFDSFSPSLDTPDAMSVTTTQPVFPLRLLELTKRKYLIHCTRSRRGPWPDQSISQFHDELLQSPWLQQPSVLGTLKRILQQQRLIATNNFRRGNMPTVCFSANEIHQLLSMRRFQSHLSRWDWEPYGIMIDQDWLLQNGAKPVSYVDSAHAKKLTPDELPYCQVVNSIDGATNWRQEREWRVAGDIRLAKVPFSKAIVFVPSLAEARILQSISRWQIAFVNSEI